MPKYLDYLISPIPIRVTDLKLDRTKLKIKTLTVPSFGVLPGRRSKRKGATYSYWAFCYIVRGHGRYKVRGGPALPVEAGGLFLVWPEENFDFGPESEDGWDEYYVCFEGDRVEEWLAGGLLQPGSVIPIGVNPQWIGKIEAIGDLLESGLPANADRAALLLESLIYEFADVYSNQTAPRIEKPEFVSVVFDDIAEHLYHPWDPQGILDRHHISYSTLRRIVFKNTGYPLNDYVHRLKMTEAKKLLHQTSFLIKEIAGMLGYEDIAYFSRLFKKYTGMSAQSFRGNL